MPVPDYQTVMLPVLQCIADGEEHSMKEVYQKIAEMFQLSDEEKAERLPSGGQSTFENRVGWAKTYLKKSGLLSSPRRGVIRITNRGKDILQKNPGKIDKKFLEQFKEFREFQGVRSNKSNAVIEKNKDSSELTPEEILGNSYQDLRNQLAYDLLEQVLQCSPTFFENLVVDLLVAMGYGGSRSDAGKAVGKSGDDGIDGIIKEDKLGLDVVNIQAKRWQNTIGRPEIQAFVGSLAGNRAKQGVFITTSKFSGEAHEYVRRIEQKVVLIDGEQLAQFMIDYNIGVSKKVQYVVKNIDLDYFESD